MRTFEKRRYDLWILFERCCDLEDKSQIKISTIQLQFAQQQNDVKYIPKRRKQESL